MQQQRQGFHIRVLGVQVEEKETLTNEEALAAFDEKDEGDTVPCRAP